MNSRQYCDAGPDTVHDIELATVGIGSNTRSYKVTW
jgi:hypothetical protein